ncbi:hypothetical protein SLE2022_390250 [Rubroshorea leprosula]
MATLTAAALPSFSSLIVHNPTTPRFSLLFPTSSKSSPPSRPFLCLSSKVVLRPRAKPSDIDTSFFDNLDPEDDIVFDPPTPPEGFVPPPSFDDGPEEAEEDIARHIVGYLC